MVDMETLEDIQPLEAALHHVAIQDGVLA